MRREGREREEEVGGKGESSSKLQNILEEWSLKLCFAIS